MGQNTERQLIRKLAAGLIGAVLLTGVLWVDVDPAHAQGRRNSRLNQLIRSKSNLYMPTRLLIGQQNKFVVRVPAGNKVVLYLSPSRGGMVAPDGTPLRVGKNNQVLEAIASEKGVATLTVPIPDEESLVGQPVFVEGYTYSREDFSDLEVLEILGPTGRQAETNYLAIDEPSDGSGAMVLPGLPGMGSEMLRRLGTMGDVYNADDRDRKTKLIDDGDRDNDFYQDRNSFIVRPDGSGGL